MDRIDRVNERRPSVGPDDEEFRRSLSRLTLHLAGRRPIAALTPPAPRRRRHTWPVLALIAVSVATVAGYQIDVSSGRPHSVAAAASPAAAATTASAASVPPVVAAPALREEQPAPAPAVEASVRGDELAPAAPVAKALPLPESALTWSEVLEVQKRLAALGLDPGPLDGVAGPRTARSAQQYGELRLLSANGTVDRSLLEALRKDISLSTFAPGAP